MGSNHGKNGGRKSRDTLPLNALSLFFLIDKKYSIRKVRDVEGGGKSQGYGLRGGV